MIFSFFRPKIKNITKIEPFPGDANLSELSDYAFGQPESWS